jgi:hypothetical protein
MTDREKLMDANEVKRLAEQFAIDARHYLTTREPSREAGMEYLKAREGLFAAIDALASPAVPAQARSDIERDAARYRWLREASVDRQGVRVVIDEVPRFLERLDRSIDAEMATTPQDGAAIAEAGTGGKAA